MLTFAYRSEIIALKCKNFVVKNKPGEPVPSGEKSSTSDVHFFLSNDVIQMDETKVEDGCGDFFIGHIHKFADIINERSD